MSHFWGAVQGEPLTHFPYLLFNQSPEAHSVFRHVAYFPA